MEDTVTEEQLQVACFQWFWNEYPGWRKMLHHNNNNSHNRVAGNINRNRGVVAGVADMELVCYGGRVVFIEFKLQGKTQSADQIDFMNKISERGHVYIIVRTLQEFKTLVCAIIGT